MFFAIPQVYTYKKLALTSWGGDLFNDSMPTSPELNEFPLVKVTLFETNSRRSSRHAGCGRIKLNCSRNPILWKILVFRVASSHCSEVDRTSRFSPAKSFWTRLCRGVSFQCMASFCPYVPFQKVQVQKLPTSNLLGSRLPARNWCMSSRRARLFLWPTHTSREHLWRTGVLVHAPYEIICSRVRLNSMWWDLVNYIAWYVQVLAVWNLHLFTLPCPFQRFYQGVSLLSVEPFRLAQSSHTINRRSTAFEVTKGFWPGSITRFFTRTDLKEASACHVDPRWKSTSALCLPQVSWAWVFQE